MALRAAPALRLNLMPGRRTWRNGPLILGHKTGQPASRNPVPSLEFLGQASYRIAGTDMLLRPIGDLFDLTTDEARRDRRQILFADS